VALLAPQSRSSEFEQPLQLLPIEAYYHLLASDYDNGRGHCPRPLQLSERLLIFGDVLGGILYAFRTKELLRPPAEHSAGLDIHYDTFLNHHALLNQILQDIIRFIRYLEL